MVVEWYLLCGIGKSGNFEGVGGWKVVGFLGGGDYTNLYTYTIHPHPPYQSKQVAINRWKLTAAFLRQCNNYNYNDFNSLDHFTI